MKSKSQLNQSSPKFDRNKLVDKLSELVLVNKESSIDNGDVGSTKDYPSDNEEETANDFKFSEVKKLDTFLTCKDSPETEQVDYIVDNSDDL